MKSRILSGSWVVCASMALFAVSLTNVAAQDSTATTPTVNASPAAPVQLSYTAAEILKLTRAKVSDDTTVAFIENSRSGYGLNAAAVVYLRNEGVSDRVITTMLNQEQKVVAAAQVAPQPVTGYAPAPADYAAADTVAPAPASTAYVIPNSSAYSYYYPYYTYDPWYYWYYYYPSLSLSYAFGNSWYWGNGYHGGYYGNAYHGGGFRGVQARGGGYRGGLPGNRSAVGARPSGGFRNGGASSGGGIRIGGRSGSGGAPSARSSGGGFRGGGAPSGGSFGGGRGGGGSGGSRH